MRAYTSMIREQKKKYKLKPVVPILDEIELEKQTQKKKI